jgi:hypothetical protein
MKRRGLVVATDENLKMTQIVFSHFLYTKGHSIESMEFHVGVGKMFALNVELIKFRGKDCYLLDKILLFFIK